ncbi:MAG: two-component regulator propeller domain-containing protein, partial [Verrucomicrobiota bacterium]
MAFESNGTAWFAAANGLYRYDGYFWHRFTAEKNGLPSNFVRSVMVSRDQRIWVGTDRGAGILNKGAGLEKWSFELLAAPEKMAGPSVRRIVEDPDGAVWFCHDAWPDARLPVGLSVLRDGHWRCYGAAEGITRPVLTYFHCSNGEQFAVVLANERQLLRREGESWHPVLNAEGFAWTMAETPGHGMVTQLRNRLHFYRHGKWSAAPLGEDYPFHIFSSRTGELLSCRPKGDHSLVIGRWNGTVFEAISPSIYTHGAWLDAVEEAPDGSIWMVGEDALFRWDRNHSEWMHFPGLPWPEVVDGQGEVWFAGDGGVFRSKESGFTLISRESGRLVAAGREHVWAWNSRGVRLLENKPPFTEVHLTAAELGLPEVFGMAAAGRDSAALFDPSAVACWTPRNRSVQTLPANLGAAAVAVDRAGRFAFLLSNQTTGLQVLSASGKASASWPEPSRNHLLSDERGGFWAYGIGGVLHLPSLDAKEWMDVTGLRGRNVLNAVEGNTGIWFAFDGSSGGTSGLARRSGDAWEQIPMPVNGALSLAADGTLLAGGPGCIYVLPREELKRIHRLSLPGNGQPRRLVVDGAGNIWVGLIGANGATSTYRYRPDKVPPAVQIVHCPQEITALEPLRVAVSGIARFRSATESNRFQYAWRLDSATWSAFHEAVEGELRIDGISSGMHQVEVRC